MIAVMHLLTHATPELDQNKYIQVAVVGHCIACGPNDIDLSTGAFAQLATLDTREISVNWNFL